MDTDHSIAILRRSSRLKKQSNSSKSTSKSISSTYKTPKKSKSTTISKSTKTKSTHKRKLPKRSRRSRIGRTPTRRTVTFDSKVMAEKWPGSKDDHSDKFVILKLEGRGGGTTAYKAQNKENGEIVQILKIHWDYDTIEDYDCYKILKSLNSPYIVNIKDMFIHDKQPWIIYEYCNGSISKFMKFADINFREIYIQIIIRELIKICTMFYGIYSGIVKLTEFEISICLNINNNSNDKSPLGTPYWMAPEICSNTPIYSIKCDIWSLGITAIEMATGKVPHSDKAPLVVLLSTPKEDPPQLPLNNKLWSQNFRAFVNLCLIKDHHKRPSTNELLKHEWIKNAKSSFLLDQWIDEII